MAIWDNCTPNAISTPVHDVALTKEFPTKWRKGRPDFNPSTPWHTG
eukprot:CAMPEP_0183554420 /NCGR_PEP_ID=MMETSP0371-20130417/78555_1 /TAXON_ID=268820 /ORGANISM="Peridinium aciculiferum, Strain PAER-2" /LENGTH=45 /DNA_ID= /DNA_START= /DNA_END= /DNA_ORIENTATION=